MIEGNDERAADIFFADGAYVAVVKAKPPANNIIEGNDERAAKVASTGLTLLSLRQSLLYANQTELQRGIKSSSSSCSINHTQGQHTHTHTLSHTPVPPTTPKHNTHLASGLAPAPSASPPVSSPSVPFTPPPAPAAPPISAPAAG